jgi:hypothetical protein
MRSWYHHLRRLLARAAGAARPGPGRRAGVRPTVEGLEDRRVPAGTVTPQGSFFIAQGMNLHSGLDILPELNEPDVLTAIKGHGQALDGVPGKALPGTMWIINGNGERERVPVALVQDSLDPTTVDVLLRRDLHIDQALGKHRIRIVIPGVADASSGTGPLELELQVYKRSRGRRGRPHQVPFTNPVPPTTTPQPQPTSPPQGYGFGGYGGGFGFGGIGGGIGANFG